MSGDTGGPSGSSTLLVPCYTFTEEGTLVKVENDPKMYQITESGEIYPSRPDTTPELESPTNETNELKRPGSANSQDRPAKKKRLLKDLGKINTISDPGSDCDNNKAHDVVDFPKIRKYTRRLRKNIVLENKSLDSDELDQEIENVQERDIGNEKVVVERIDGRNILGAINMNKELRCGAKKEQRSTPAPASRIKNFAWSEDFSAFKGQKECYSRLPGPTFSFQNPTDLFHKIWDYEIMEKIVRNTNIYASEVIRQLSNSDDTNIPRYLKSWTEVTIDELYRYFAVLIYLSLCHRAYFREYWRTGLLGMPKFRSIMSQTRFNLINIFLHFAPNADLLMKGHERIIEKVTPVLDHLNSRFADMYTPAQYLNIEELYLLGNSRASFAKWSKAARFGIKNLELSDAETGYLLQYRLYKEKKDETQPDSHGSDITPIFLDLIESYLDLGHVLVMDNWYDQLSITRYLKSRHTDVLASINHQRQGVPPAIKNLTTKKMKRGTSVSRHCGDIALVAYKTLEIRSILSTYHHHATFLGKRVGKNVLKPAVFQEYCKYRTGVILKDQKLSCFPMERNLNRKWYMKVFRRLLNTSLLNAFIIHRKNNVRDCSQRHFRVQVAEGLLSRFPQCLLLSRTVPQTPDTDTPVRLQPGTHYPIHTNFISETGKGARRQLRCVRCTALKRRSTVNTKCETCNVALCFGPCWRQYHCELDLKKPVNVNT